MQVHQYNEKQSISVLKDGEAEAKASDLCSKYGMSGTTCYSPESKYSGETASDLKRIKALDAEGRSLKKTAGEQPLDIHALKNLLLKVYFSP